jgi:hypothetical protein
LASSRLSADNASRIGGNKFAAVNEFAETTTINVSDKIRIGLGANEILYGDGAAARNLAPSHAIYVSMVISGSWGVGTRPPALLQVLLMAIGNNGNQESASSVRALGAR